jgi:hypothetical protein
MAIADRVKRQLWASSAGLCQNPACRDDLFRVFADGAITSIDELAHVIAQRSDGPRGNDQLPLSERDEFENVIVLCPSCHTLADKVPQHHPPELLRRWKRTHKEIVRRALLTPILKDRLELRSEVQPLLERNKGIFEAYGPHSRASINPLAEAAKQWRRLVLIEILPNNKKIAALLEINRHLLKAEEQATLRAFVVHAEALEYNHVSGDKNPVAPLFPNEMDSILE